MSPWLLTVAQAGSRGERSAQIWALSAVDEEFGSGDEACVGGSEEDGGTGDVIGITDAPERDGRGHMVEQALQLRCVGACQGSIEPPPALTNSTSMRPASVFTRS
jgi:hypothetical protein